MGSYKTAAIAFVKAERPKLSVALVITLVNAARTKRNACVNGVSEVGRKGVWGKRVNKIVFRIRSRSDELSRSQNSIRTPAKPKAS